MQATVEPLEGNRVKLLVEVEEDEFTRVLDDAIAEVAHSIRLPGFRPGKAPRKLVEARLGKETLREEAIRDSLPDYVRRAVRETGTDAIGSPEVEITSGPDDSVLTFHAVVETRPKPSIAGYAGLRVTLPSPEATDEEVDRQIDRMREQFGELNEVHRPAVEGDHVTVDVSAHRHSETVDDLTVSDFVYEIGSAGFVEGLDDEVRGAKSGDIFKFNAPHPSTGDEVSVQLLVKEVKEKLLPDATDQWASEASEFATIAELRADIGSQIREVKKVQATMALRSEAARELSALVHDDVPEVLVAEEMEIRLRDLQARLSAQGATIQQFLAATVQDARSFTDGLRQAAESTVRLDLALRSLADAESIVASEAEVDEKIQSLAEISGNTAADVRRTIESGQGLDAVRWEIRKSKAMAWLEDHVEIVDEEGRPVDRARLNGTDDVEGEGECDGGSGRGEAAVPGTGSEDGSDERSRVGDGEGTLEDAGGPG